MVGHGERPLTFLIWTDLSSPTGLDGLVFRTACLRRGCRLFGVSWCRRTTVDMHSVVLCESAVEQRHHHRLSHAFVETVNGANLNNSAFSSPQPPCSITCERRRFDPGQTEYQLHDSLSTILTIFGPGRYSKQSATCKSGDGSRFWEGHQG